MNLKTNSFILLGTLVVAGILVGAAVNQSSDAITLDEYKQTQVDPSFLDDDSYFVDQLDPVDETPTDVEDEPFDESESVDPSDSDFSFVEDQIGQELSPPEEELNNVWLALTPEQEVELENSWIDLSTNFTLKYEGKTWSTISPEGLTKCVVSADSKICYTKGYGVIFTQSTGLLFPDIASRIPPAEALAALAKFHPLGEVQPWEVILVDGKWCFVSSNTREIHAYDPSDGSAKSYPLASYLGRQWFLEERQ